MKLPLRTELGNTLATLLASLLLAAIWNGTALAAQTANAASKAANAAEPWTQQELIGAAELAKVIADPNSKKPVILDIGVASLLRGGLMIKGSTVIGPANNAQNLEKLRSVVSGYPKDAELVIYCGCCPFKDCPNIRPAFKQLKEMKFTQVKLLDLPKNLKTDWITPGFPTEKQL
jgi:thiosulfate/3-mercaptopyruvate sulfurtransferase